MRILLFSFILLLSGCATFKNLFSSDEKKANAAAAAEPSKPTLQKFSDNSFLPSTAARDYKRMTRQRLEEESFVNAQAGSMWVMDGQSSYLFAQNKSRREGDMLNVKLEGAAQQQVMTKVAVIKKILKQLEEEERRAKELEYQKKLLELQQQAQAQQGSDRAPASSTTGANGTPPPAAVVPPPPPPVANSEKEKDEEVKLDTIASRISEKQVDGNYRIKGQQTFMIGKKEYKVIVTGLLRPEDFNDEGISSNKLMDPQYDVVSIRRKEL